MKKYAQHPGFIEAIAGKLGCDELTTQTYTREKAKAILSNCVLANKCIECLEENEELIKNMLPHTLFVN